MRGAQPSPFLSYWKDRIGVNKLTFVFKSNVFYNKHIVIIYYYINKLIYESN